MMGQFGVNPWVRGFQPPSKCAFCKHVNTLVFTGGRTENGDHIYRCVYCNSTIGSPTMYGYCYKSGFPERLEKDTFYTECVACKFRSPIPSGRPGAGVCRYLRIRPYEEFV